MDTSYNCVICLKDLDMDDGVLTPCNHRYHSSCFFKWIHKKRTCPLCRKELIAAPDMEERASLYELRRQLDWENTVYNTLRNNTRVLEERITNHQEELNVVKSKIEKAKNQLSIIAERYNNILINLRRFQRRRRNMFY